MKKRYLFWDNYKGILIFLVVYGHFLYSYVSKYNGSFVDDVFTFIYTFHMPAFVFSSGYLSKSEKSRSKAAIVKLGLYYLVFNTLMMIFCYFLKGTTLKILTPYYSCWYILSLIVWRLAVDHLSEIKGIVPISLAASLLIGYWGEFSNVLSLKRTVAFFIFFLLGYLWSEENFEKLLEKRNTKKSVVGAVFAVVAAVVAFLIIRHHDITKSMLLMSKYDSAGDILYRIFILAVSVCAIIAMLLVVPNRKIPILTQIGKNSLLIYLVHRFITLICDKLFSFTNYSRFYLVYALAATLLTVLVFGNERLNCRVADAFNKATACVLDRESGRGNIMRTGILVLLILILAWGALTK